MTVYEVIKIVITDNVTRRQSIDLFKDRAVAVSQVNDRLTTQYEHVCELKLKPEWFSTADEWLGFQYINTKDQLIEIDYQIIPRTVF